MSDFKSGFIAVVGKPNVGKSSLVNALVGEKVAITSPKPQTTRNRIFGILNTNDYQMIFVDTPGEVRGQSKLSKFMQKSIEVGASDVDAVMIVLDATKVGQVDYEIIERYANAVVPVFIVINKIDVASYEQVYPVLAKLNEYKFVREFVSTSALKGKNLDELKEKLEAVLPNGTPLYDRDVYTDRNIRFMVREIIREKLLLFVQDEIPHFAAVEILAYNETNKLVKISADIICDKDSHKEIIVGKRGAMIKQIGTSARFEIEKLVGKKVYLELFVKIKEGWQTDSKALKDLGYDIKTDS